MSLKWINEKCGQQQMVTFCERLMKIGLKYATQSSLLLSRSEFDTSSYERFLLRNVQSIINKSWSDISNKTKLPMF